MTSLPAPDSTILCVGEVLWDALPRGLFLGGAPFNVAAHLHNLGTTSILASRVGDDVLGDEAVRRIRERGMPTRLIQRDAEHRTGFVEVSLDPDGVADYTIIEPVAWDAIEMSQPLLQQARTARAVVFGSLAQRNATTRTTIQMLTNVTSGWRVYDVNLRPPYTPRAVVETSIDHADVIKLNDDEVAIVCGWLDLPTSVEEGAAALGEVFNLHACCVTQGGDGATLWHNGTLTTNDGYAVTVADTVGAGDSFLAALLTGLLDGTDDTAVLDRACRLGALVASKEGATPVIPEAALDAL